MKVRDIIEVMEQHYPLEIQEEWDKCGLQIGDKNSDVNKIIIALNADRQTLKKLLIINAKC